MRTVFERKGMFLMKFIIGSMNKAKVEAATTIILAHHLEAEISTVASESGVSAQPIGDAETIKGAINRAKYVQRSHPEAIGIGLEGGVRLIGEQMYICNWGALSLPNRHTITAGGAQIQLPNELAEKMNEGQELGPVIEAYFKQQGLRQKEGAMGIFTAGLITRVDLFEHIMQLLIGQLAYYHSVEGAHLDAEA